MYHPPPGNRRATCSSPTQDILCVSCDSFVLLAKCIRRFKEDDEEKIHVLARHWLANEIPNLVWRFHKFQIVSHVVLRLKRTTFEMGLSSSFQSPCTPTNIKRLLHMHTHSIPDYMFVPVEDESIHFLHANSRVLILLPLPSHLKQHSP